MYKQIGISYTVKLYWYNIARLVILLAKKSDLRFSSTKEKTKHPELTNEFVYFGNTYRYFKMLCDSLAGFSKNTK